MHRSRLRHAQPAVAAAVLLGAVAALGAPRAVASVAVAGHSDFAGLVDIGGGRRMYLECRGTGTPTVLLEAGYRTSADIWSADLIRPDAPRPMVLPSVAGFARVCAYDRPGTIGLAVPGSVSRGDLVPQPRTAQDAVADVHTLL